MIAILTILYVLVATFAIIMTLLEQCEEGINSVMCKFLGLLACAVWPLTFLVVAVAVQLHPPPAAQI